MITGRDFLTLAQRWVQGTAEGEWRSAVSRAYYAAFHEARQLLRDLGFQVPPESPNWAGGRLLRQVRLAPMTFEAISLPSGSAMYTLCDGKTIASVQDIGKKMGCALSGGKRWKTFFPRSNSCGSGADDVTRLFARESHFL